MTRPFTYPALPTRVVFGAHAVRRLFDEVAALAPHPRARALLPEQKPTGELIAAALGDHTAGVLPEARMHSRSRPPATPER
jgi:maleylacetate reductase